MNKVIKFSADWCKPCKILGDQIESLKDSFTTEIVSVDIETSAGLTKKYNIRSIPTLIKVSATGDELCRHTGSITSEELVRFVNE
jgi:thioredoxin 1